MSDSKPRDTIADTVPALGSAPGKTVADTLPAPVSTVDDTLPAASGAGPVSVAESLAASLPPTTRAYAGLLAIERDHYIFGKEIARGGMGRIRTAHDRRLGRDVAIKELLTDSADLRTRFEREARITAKLQHPAIVSIHEAGTWASGEPFYVMKLVTGESLDKVVGQRGTIASRLGLLPNVIAVVDALAYAHSRRVIHRDLKPANVLVGEFGETVVIDWGLAKDLGDAEPSEPAGPIHAAGPGETVAGAVMGTPAYMSPEQAAGDLVDERTDVYALGALLYHVLAGEPPYAGRSTAKILTSVIAGPPRPLGEHGDVPPDLVTIVEKAMARTLADRYPTAGELVADLKKFQTGQLVDAHRYSRWQLARRWLRRHRTPVAVAGIALTVLIGLGIVGLREIFEEQANTNVQRVEAEQNRHDAESLMAFMLTDLYATLQPIGKLELLGTVARKAMDYYDRRRDRPESDADRAQHAQALQNIGEVLLKQNDVPGALAQQQAARAIRERLAAQDSSNREWQRALGASHQSVGNVVARTGDEARALLEIRASLAIFNRIAALEPTNFVYQRHQAIAHLEIGNLLKNQGAVTALDSYRSGLTIAEALAASDPRGDAQALVGALRGRIGDYLRSRGDVDRAHAESTLQLAIYERLVTAEPGDFRWRNARSTAHNKLAEDALGREDGTRALEHARAALVDAEQVAASDPSNAEWQRGILVSRNYVAHALEIKRDYAGALVERRAVLALTEQMAARSPSGQTWQAELALAHFMVSVMLAQQGDHHAALESTRTSAAIAEKVVALDPSNGEQLDTLALALNHNGELLVILNNPSAAVDVLRRALAIREKQVAGSPGQLQWLRGLRETELSLGEALALSGDLTEAIRLYRSSLAGLQTLAAGDPNDPGLQDRIAVTAAFIGDALVKQGKTAEAIAPYREALAVTHRMVMQDTSVDMQLALATNHEKLGDALVTTDGKSARAEYRACLAIVTALVVKDPKRADLRVVANRLRVRVASCCSTP